MAMRPDGLVSMIALGGPKLKQKHCFGYTSFLDVSMIALGGPKLKPCASTAVSLLDPFQ